jgi:hypothetical protein
MGAVANLSTAALDVEPGAEATVGLQVRNTGSVVDEFRFEVVGPTAEWTTVDPVVLPLFPGDEGTVTALVAPPRLPTTPAGELPFGIKVNSREDPDGSVVEEGTVTVAAFSDVTAELVPRTSRGRRGAIHNLAVDNRGNTTLEARLSANEPNGLLRSSVVPPAISVPPGTATFAKVRLRPVKRFLQGPSKSHPFQARVEAEGAVPLVLDGAMLQDPLLPSWAMKALALVAAAVIVAAVLWLALVKPQIKAAAKDQVNKQLTAAGVSVPASSANTPAGAGAKAPAGGATGSGGTNPSGGAATGPLTGTANGPPVDGRLAITGNGTTPYVVPSGHTLELTDIVLENPNGDPGNLIIARSGQVLLQLSMANFRDLDYHFVSPIVFRAGSQLQLITAGCTTACSPGVYFSGYLPASS